MAEDNSELIAILTAALHDHLATEIRKTRGLVDEQLDEFGKQQHTKLGHLAKLLDDTAND